MSVNKLSRMSVHEVLLKAAEAPTKVDKQKVLRAYNSLALRDVLKGSFDDSVKFILPKGKPPFTPCRPESIPSSLNKLSKQFKFFVVGGPGEKLAKVKTEVMLIKILDSIHPDDAELIIKMKDKALTGVYKGVTKALVMEAFPGLISE